jgi:hypothetical protein
MERFNGDFFSVHQWTHWPPFFHIILSDVFKIIDFVDLLDYKLEIVLIINILLSVVSSLFLYFIAKDITKNRIVSITVAGTYAFSYPLVYLNAFILTENFAIPGVIISIWLLFRERWFCFVISAILLASAVALRPVFGLLGLAFFLYILFYSGISKQSLLRSIIFSTSFLAVIFMVMAENYHISKGKLRGLSSAGGVLFYLANSKEQIHRVECSWDGIFYWIAPISTLEHPEHGTVKFDGVSINDQKFFFKLGLEEIRRNPEIWITKFLKMKQLFFGLFWPYEYSALFYGTLMKVSQVLLFLMFLFSLLVYICFKTMEVSRAKLALLISLVLCQTLIMYFFNVEQRYVYGFAFVFYITFFTTIFVLIKHFCRFAWHLYIFIALLIVVSLISICAKAFNLHIL